MMKKVIGGLPKPSAECCASSKDRLVRGAELQGRDLPSGVGLGETRQQKVSELSPGRQVGCSQDREVGRKKRRQARHRRAR